MENVGYRDDTVFGSGERYIVDVCTYEIFELGNDGIFDYCIANYELDDRLVDKMQEVLDNDNLRSNEDAVREAVEELVENLGRIFRTKLEYCLWLCDSPDDVVDEYIEPYYGDDGEKTPEDYDLNIYRKSGIVLDDCGDSQGKLYAYSSEEFDNAYVGALGDED